jgi:hypothetical protein
MRWPVDYHSGTQFRRRRSYGYVRDDQCCVVLHVRMDIIYFLTPRLRIMEWQGDFAHGRWVCRHERRWTVLVRIAGRLALAGKYSRERWRNDDDQRA